MKKLKTAIALIITFAGLLFCSAFLSSKPDYQKATEDFLKGIINGQVASSYDEFLTDSPLADKVEAIERQKQQTSVLFENYGKLLDWEFVKKQLYGQSIVRLVYIIKCERTPLVWEFYIYKAEKQWDVISLKFRDNYDLLADK